MHDAISWLIENRDRAISAFDLQLWALRQDRTISARGYDVHAWTRTQGDITRPATLAEHLRDTAPAAVINCAAYARVDEAEDEPAEALTINAWAIRDLAPRLCALRR